MVAHGRALERLLMDWLVISPAARARLTATRTSTRGRVLSRTGIHAIERNCNHSDPRAHDAMQCAEPGSMRADQAGPFGSERGHPQPLVRILACWLRGHRIGTIFEA